MSTVTNFIGESTSSISMWNIVNHKVSMIFSCESVVNNLKEKKVLAPVNRNHFNLILDRSENPRYLL